MPSNAELTARRLDITARGIDLVSSIAHVTGSSSPLIRIPWEIGQWLGREKLNQHELENCLQRAKGLVIANEHGQALFEGILRGTESKPIGPLFLQQSGSLGRLIAHDPNLSWMISTIACLFQYYRDVRHITHTVASFIVRSGTAQGTRSFADSSQHLTYSPEQIQIMPVVSKIVSSVWHNVINSGCDALPLPPELMSICSRGHYLDSDDLCLVIHTITFQCKAKAVLRTDFLLRDVVLWLFYHYDGHLVITVSGRVIYEQDFGNPRRELEVHVKSSCPDGEPCAKDMAGFWEILQNIRGNLEDFISGHCSSSSDTPPQPGFRQPLYTINQDYEEHILYDRGIQALIKCTAQRIMRWMLSTPVLPQKDFSNVGFTAVCGENTVNSTSEFGLRDVLYRTPSILQFNWGVTPEPPIIFFDKESKSTDTSNSENDPLTIKLGTILDYFPILDTLLMKVCPQCMCTYCSAKGDKKRRLKRGCLGRLAIEQVLFLLAHGIADGFGVSDRSAVSVITPTLNGIATVLLELCRERKVVWDTWFGTAACVCLGCPFKPSPEDDDDAIGGNAMAAIQYGNLAAIAPWLDLTRQFAVKGCFRLIVAEGRIAIHAKSFYNDEVEVQSVAGTFAIIVTEQTEDNTELNYREIKAVLPSGSQLHLKEDDTRVECDTILTGVDDIFYRLLMRFKTPGHWRIVDPSDALNGVIRRINMQSCSHPPSLETVVWNPSKLYSLEEMLGRWPDLRQDMLSINSEYYNNQRSTKDIIHLSHILDTHLKLNIALALSVSTTAIENHTGSCCLQCAIEMSKAAERDPLGDRERGDVSNRYIINLDPCLGTAHARHGPKLIQQGDPEDLESDSGC